MAKAPVKAGDSVDGRPVPSLAGRISLFASHLDDLLKRPTPDPKLVALFKRLSKIEPMLTKLFVAWTSERSNPGWPAKARDAVERLRNAARLMNRLTFEEGFSSHDTKTERTLRAKLLGAIGSINRLEGGHVWLVAHKTGIDLYKPRKPDAESARDLQRIANAYGPVPKGRRGDPAVARAALLKYAKENGIKPKELARAIHDLGMCPRSDRKHYTPFEFDRIPAGGGRVSGAEANAAVEKYMRKHRAGKEAQEAADAIARELTRK